LRSKLVPQTVSMWALTEPSKFRRHLHLVLRAIASLPPSRSSNPPPVVIHAHKADLLSSSSPATPPTQQTLDLAKDRVRTVLERELDKRRKTFAKDVRFEGLGADAGVGDDSGGSGLDCATEDGTFRFDRWEAGNVEFSAGWVEVVREDGITSTSSEKEKETEGGSLRELKEWLDELV